MSETTSGLSLLKRLQARELLGDFPIIASLSALKTQATYKDLPFPDYIDKLQGEIHSIPEMALWAEVDLGNASHYLTTLVRSYEATIDGINRVHIDATCFLGRVRVVYTKAQSLKAPFQALWTIGAGDLLAGSPLAKLGAKDLAALANMEFSTFLEEADLEWAAVIETVELILDNLKAMRKLAADKFAMGKDQVNAALSEMDIPDAGLGAAPAATRPSSSAGVETLKGMFGDRVKKPEVQVAPETEDDLPPDLRTPAVDLDDMPTAPESEFPGVDTAEEASGPEPEITPEMVQASVEADALVQTPDGPKAVEDLQVGDKVLVVGDDLPLEPGVHEVAMVVAPEVAAVSANRDMCLTKPKKGEALVVPFNLDVQVPGTLHVSDFLIGKGKTKFALIAQDNPAENGIYRFMGPDAPLARLDAEPQAEAKPETKGHPEPEHREVQVELPPQALPQQTLTPEMEKTILADPFLGAAKAQEVVDTIKAAQDTGDDLPPEEETTTPAPEAEDDLPPEEDTTTPAAEELPGESGLDEDDLPPEGPVVDRTKATQELADGADPEAALDEPAAPEAATAEPEPAPEAPKPEVKIQVATSIATTQAAAPSASSAPKPGGLFRSRVVTPGTTAAPAFKPAQAPEAPAVATDDLGELM